MKIRNRMLASVLVPVIAVLVLITWLSYSTGRSALQREIQAHADSMLKAYSWELNADISYRASVAKGLAAAMEALKPSSLHDIDQLIQTTLARNPSIYGSAIAFQPGSFRPDQELTSAYHYRSGDELRSADLSSPDYDYPSWSWFTVPRETKTAAWSEPYIDEGGGGVVMTTFSCPFYRNGEFWGVATVDVSLSDLTEEIEGIKVGQTGGAFLLSKRGKFLSSPGDDTSLDRSILQAAEELGREELKILGARMMAGEEDLVFIIDPRTAKPAWVAFAPIPSAGWSLAISFPEDELMAEIAGLHRRSVIIAAAGLVAIMLVLLWISYRIARPVQRLAETANSIAAGDLSVPPPGASAKDELGTLARAFRDMEISLMTTMERLRQERGMCEACFSQMQEAIVIFDDRWNVLQHNMSAAALMMLPCEGPFWEHIKARYDISVPVETILDSSGEPIAFELTRRESEESGDLNLAGLVTPIKDSAGKRAQIALSVRNVTEEVREEGSKRNFLALISHKLKTPVTVLKSNIAMMKDGLLGPMSDSQSRQTSAMANQIARLEAVIEELVGFVTIERAEISNAREDIDLKAALAELAAAAKERYQDKAPEVEIKVDEGAGVLRFNRRYLDLVAGQMIDNGLKFNLNRPARVEVNCRKQGGATLIEFADNGTGIPPEFVERIFDKFYQVERYFTGNVEGVGLGLSYVKKLVEHFGGKVSVRSVPGQGSVFTVRLPS